MCYLLLLLCLRWTDKERHNVIGWHTKEYDKKIKSCHISKVKWIRQLYKRELKKVKGVSVMKISGKTKKEGLVRSNSYREKEAHMTAENGGSRPVWLAPTSFNLVRSGMCVLVFFTITLSDSAANMNRRSAPVPIAVPPSLLQTLSLPRCSLAYRQSAGLVSFCQCLLRPLPKESQGAFTRCERGVYPWAQTSCAAHLGCMTGLFVWVKVLRLSYINKLLFTTKALQDVNEEWGTEEPFEVLNRCAELGSVEFWAVLMKQF